jgi:hypothetical protein
LGRSGSDTLLVPLLNSSSKQACALRELVKKGEDVDVDWPTWIQAVAAAIAAAAAAFTAWQTRRRHTGDEDRDHEPR